MFKCKGCNEPIKGPAVRPNETNNPTPGTPFRFGVVPGVACKNAWHKEFIYTGKEELPPDPPPLPGAKPPALPTIWAANAEGGYTAQRKYPNIPDTHQTALIAALDPILGDTSQRVPLLGASYDRFDDYDDVEDDAAADLGSAEKWLTTPMVLNRINLVAGELAPLDLWKQALVNQQLGGHSAHLMLPSGVDGYKFHAELLRDLVNPRGGHSVAADTYAQAVKKAIALRKTNTPGNSVQGTKRSYFFYSTRSKRGITAVITNDAYVLTVYYGGAATRWWTDPLTPEVRLARTIA